MKDVSHHLKHTQKKVIQSARKEQVQELLVVAINNGNEVNNANFSKKSRKPSYWTS